MDGSRQQQQQQQIQQILQQALASSSVTASNSQISPANSSLLGNYTFQVWIDFPISCLKIVVNSSIESVLFWHRYDWLYFCLAHLVPSSCVSPVVCASPLPLQFPIPVCSAAASPRTSAVGRIVYTQPAMMAGTGSFAVIPPSGGGATFTALQVIGASPQLGGAGEAVYVSPPYACPFCLIRPLSWENIYSSVECSRIYL